MLRIILYWNDRWRDYEVPMSILKRWTMLSLLLLLLLALFPSHGDGRHHFYSWRPTPSQFWSEIDALEAAGHPVERDYFQGMAIDYPRTAWEGLILVLAAGTVCLFWPLLQACPRRAWGFVSPQISRWRLLWRHRSSHPLSR